MDLQHVLTPLGPVVKTLVDLVIEEGKFLYGVQDQVEGLRTEFNRIERFLRDAASRKIGEDRIREWVLEAKDIAYDAEHLLEGYVFKIGSRSNGIHGFVRHRFGKKILKIHSRFSNLTRSFLEYGVTAAGMEREGTSCVQQQLRRSYSFVEDEDFVGLEKDVDLLVTHLVNGDDHNVVSIFGIGGLGKTTLANKVYKHPGVKRHFDRFAWICVSQRWQTIDILQRILIELEPENKKETEKLRRENDLIRSLLLVQQQRRCLIVLDDIWTTDAWDCIKVAFPIGQNRSKILLTTRKEQVASRIGPDGFHHQPRLLTEEESWDLLCKKAVRERNHDKGHYMNQVQNLGKEMVKHCAGLPLAVRVLGGILLTKHCLSDWEIVHRNIKSYLWRGKGFGEGKGDLNNILGLSYYDLPFQLRPCFLYLSSFPEDATINADTLYQLWIAEGMILKEDREGDESLMELAERYLRELEQRGMVQLQKLELPGMRRRFQSCRIHDVMRDLCLHEAEHEGFLKYVNYFPQEEGNIDVFGSLSTPPNCKLRRAVITLEHKKPVYTPRRREMPRYLRMLKFQNPYFCHFDLGKVIKSQLNVLDSFEMLRVLSLEMIASQYDTRRNAYYFPRLPPAVGKLIHLRYLSLRGSSFGKLPSSLGSLKYLHTLDLRLLSECVASLGNILRKMEGLTCLYLPEHVKKTCWGKIRLEGLQRLEILENFCDYWFETKDLVKLTNLRVLKISQCCSFENLVMIATYAQRISALESVSIFTANNFSTKSRVRVLEMLLYGKNIHSLKIRGTVWKFPEYKPSNLVSLKVAWSELDAEEICWNVERFSHLRRLKLHAVKGKEMCFHGYGFPRLEDLKLVFCRELEEWMVEEGAMPNLQTLEIYKCSNLKAIPDGLRFITNLEELVIEKMPLEFQERIRTADHQEGEDFYKVRHVPLIRFINH